MALLLDQIIGAFIAAPSGTKTPAGRRLAVVAALLRGKGLAVELDAGSWAYRDGDQLVRSAKVDMFVCDEKHSALIDIDRAFPRENRTAKLLAAAADFKVLILEHSQEIPGIHAVLGMNQGEVWKADPIEVPDHTDKDPAHVSRRLRRAIDQFIQTQDACRAAGFGGLPLKDFNRFMKHLVVKATIERRLAIIRAAIAEVESA